MHGKAIAKRVRKRFSNSYIQRCFCAVYIYENCATTATTKGISRRVKTGHSRKYKRSRKFRMRETA